MSKSYFSKVAGFYRSSHLSYSLKNGVLRKAFAKLTGKHLCQRLFFNKGKFLYLKFLFCKMETSVQVFYCEFCEISQNTFFYGTPPDDCFCFQLKTLLKWTCQQCFENLFFSFNMKRIAYISSFAPCKNQRELLTSVVFAVNRY